MTQFDFLATWQDSWDLITAILSSKAYSLTADVYYLEPNAVALTTF